MSAKVVDEAVGLSVNFRWPARAEDRTHFYYGRGGASEWSAVTSGQCGWDDGDGGVAKVIARSDEAPAQTSTQCNLSIVPDMQRGGAGQMPSLG